MGIMLQQLVAGAGLIAGSLLVLGGLVLLFVRAHLGARRGPTPEPARVLPPTPAPLFSAYRWIPAGLLVVIVLAGSGLRLDDLSGRSLTHTEVIVPTIDLPAEISLPLPRHTLVDTLWWHFHVEGHPQGYYLLMWVWSKLFGTSLYWLRLPSVLFGIASILLIFQVAAHTHDRVVGLISAGLLAFNGFHIFVSQYARMYAMGCCLGLLSTVLLLHLLRVRDRRLLWEGLYVVVTALGIYTQVFFWLVLAVQMLWIVLRQSADGVRLLSLQALVVLLGAPSLAHVLYLGDDVDLPGPSLAFVWEYLSFGFLFRPDLLSIPPRALPVGATLLLLFVALCCIGRALKVPGHPARVGTDVGVLPTKRLLPISIGSVLIILALAMLASRRQAAIAAVSLVPLLALMLPSALGRLSGVLQYRFEKVSARLKALPGVLTLPFLLALIPLLAIIAFSFWISLLSDRAFLIFIPYVLIVGAAGLKSLSRRVVVGVPLVVLLIVAHALSIAHFRDAPTDQIDYEGLALQMAARHQEGDLVFVRPKDWVTTPLYYYLKGEKYQFVASDYKNTLSEHPEARIWLLRFGSVRWGTYKTTTEEMYTALSGYRLEQEVRSRRGRGLLYVKGD